MLPLEAKKANVHIYYGTTAHLLTLTIVGEKNNFGNICLPFTAHQVPNLLFHHSG